jgi:2-methylcitrate dehydratase PrpD
MTATTASMIVRVAEFAAQVRENGLPEQQRRQMTRHLLDVIGNCLAASGEPVAQIVLGTAAAWGGAEQAWVIGASRRLPAPAAALVNGTLAHAMDFDDTHLPSVLHPSASVVPAALAAAEAAGASGSDLLTAIAVGDEICIRLGMAGYDEGLGNSIFFERGQHATAICGAIGAAVAVAMLDGLPASGIADAAAIAASMGSGLLEANRTGGTVKRVHTGWAAHGGVIAAQLARNGLTGPPTVLEGRFGFFEAWCGSNARPERVVEDLGAVWDCDELHIKPYPCNHFTHAGIDAALALREQGIRGEDIAEIELVVPRAVLRTIAEPPELKAAPPSGYAAAFSGPYTIAAALLGGGGLGVHFGDFTDAAARDPDRLAMAATVKCASDRWCDDLFPRQLPAIVRVRTRSGERHEIRVATNRGGPARPLSESELATKFRLGARTRLGEGQIDELYARVTAVGAEASVHELLAATHADPRSSRPRMATGTSRGG